VRRVIAAYRLSFSGLPRPVWLLAGAVLVNRAGTMVLPFLSLYLTRELGFTAVRAGQILSLYGVGSMVGSTLGGWLSDRIGAVRVQGLSLAATGLGFLVLTRITDFSALAASVFVVSVVSESFRPAVMTSVAEHSRPPIRARCFALVRLSVNTGMAVGPAVGGFLAAQHYTLLFVVDAATCWAAAAVLWATLGFSRPPPSMVSGTEHQSRTSPWRDVPFLAFLGLIVLLGVIFLQIWVTLPLELRDSFGFSERGIGLLIALNPAMIVAFEMVLMRAVERLGSMRVAAVGAGLVGCGLAILTFGHSLLVAVCSTLVWTLGEMLSLPMTNAVAAERAGSGAAGRYMGAYTLAFSTAFVLAPVLGGWTYQRHGGDALWSAAGVAGVLLFISFWALGRHLSADPEASKKHR